MPIDWELHHIARKVCSVFGAYVSKLCMRAKVTECARAVRPQLIGNCFMTLCSKHCKKQSFENFTRARHSFENTSPGKKPRKMWDRARRECPKSRCFSWYPASSSCHHTCHTTNESCHLSTSHVTYQQVMSRYPASSSSRHTRHTTHVYVICLIDKWHA